MITVKNIIKEGNSNLTKVSKEVVLPLSDADKTLALSLLEYVINSQNPILAEQYNLRPAVGIAAVQVNKLKRMFAMHCVDFDDVLYSYIIINPIITKRSSELTYLPGGEGCLSVEREVSGVTPRYLSLEFKAHKLDFTTHKLELITMVLTGFPAIVFQHEYDHLDGVLFTSKVFDSLPNVSPLWQETDSDQ